VAAAYVGKPHLPGGRVRLGDKEGSRDGESDMIWRRRPSGSAAAGRPPRGGFFETSFAPRPVGLFGHGDVPSLFPFDTHYLYAHVILETLCKLGLARRHTLETKMHGGRAIGGGSVRVMDGSPKRY
jgi:hypothetical protein